MELIFALALATAAVVSPSGVELERLADRSYDPPGLVGGFIIEVLPPVPCGDVVLFNGITFADSRLGAYSASSEGVEVIANPTTPVPGSDKTFQDAQQFACAGDRIFFIGDDDTTPSSSGPSVYTYTEGIIAPFLEVGTPIDGNFFTGFGDVDANATTVALDSRLFPTSTNQALVMKPLNGEPFIVADRTTVLPGQTDPATIFAEPVLVGSDLVFHARTKQNLGIYRWSPGQGISIVADTLTPEPALDGGTFGPFDLWIASLDYGIVFGAAFSGGSGIFVSSGGQVRPLVLPGDTTVDGEVITAASFPSGAGSLLTFSVRTAGSPFVSVFVRTADGKIKRILGEGDTIEGELVLSVISRADRENVAIRIDSIENEVIYRARFPEPNVIPALSIWGIAVLALGLTLVGARLLRR